MENVANDGKRRKGLTLQKKWLHFTIYLTIISLSISPSSSPTSSASCSTVAVISPSPLSHRRYLIVARRSQLLLLNFIAGPFAVAVIIAARVEKT
jgi:hypothetical protein